MTHETSPVHQVSKLIRRQLITLNLHAIIALLGILCLAGWHCRMQGSVMTCCRYVVGSIWRDQKREMGFYMVIVHYKKCVKFLIIG